MKTKAIENNEKTTEVAGETAASSAIQETKEDRLVLVLADPFVYDGKTITEIDMEGMMDLTAGDLCMIDSEMIRRGYTGTRMEVTRQYAMLVAAKANKKAPDFCDRMKARDSIRLKDMVTAFFFVRG